MKLKKLIKNITGCQVRGSKEVEILGLSNNSKRVSPGQLFIAKKGHVEEGSKYIPEAVQSGAAAIVTDIFDPTAPHIPQILHPNPNQLEPLLAREFYGEPSKELTLIGITGTNGKTTSAYLIKHLLDRVNRPSGLIGTIEYIVGPATISATRTTPDVIGNQRMLREMVDAKQKACVMEVTSHALVQGRTEGLFYDLALYTNLSTEHLDYHETMEKYAAAKQKLFLSLNSTVKKNAKAVVNIDCPWHALVTKGTKVPIVTFSCVKAADFRAENIVLSQTGTIFTLLHQGKSYDAFTPLVGRYNLYNSLGAIASLHTLHFPLEAILKEIRSFSRVRGRLEPVENPLDLSIFVDFAHTDDALCNVLTALTEFKHGKIITVFGAGGDRDKTKRPLMAEVVEKFSDFAIVTTDNPRSENPEKIIQEIASGFSKTDRFQIEIDRSKAIEMALRLGKPGDIILIAGKGHETYQIFQHKTIEFDDKKIAAELATKIAKKAVTA